MDLLVAGDYCPINRVTTLLKDENYDSVLGEVKPLIMNSDYSIVNLECPIAYGNEKSPLDRLSLSCGEEGVKALKWAGFNCVTLANNHFRDKGDDGVNNTIQACRSMGLDYVGGGENLEEAKKTLYKTINSEKLAIINCCEHEFSLAKDNRGGSNPLNLVSQYNAIKKAKEDADYVIVIVHGGHEHYQLPSPRMIEAYRFFIDAGADVVLNHHQHCFSGYERYNNKMIFYGLGNFCFDMTNPPTQMWYEGYSVKLHLQKSGIDFTLSPYTQCKDQANISLKPEATIQQRLSELNHIISSKELLTDATNKYYDNSCKAVEGILFPYFNKYIRALWTRHLFPRVITKRWQMYLFDYIMCESHRDKMEHYFEKNMY